MESASRSVPSLRFTTENLAPADRFEAWRGYTAALAEAAPARDGAPGDFAVDATGWNLGAVIVGQGRYGAQTWDRGAGVIRRSEVDGYMFTCVRAGSPIAFEMGDNRVLVRPGATFVTDFGTTNRKVYTGPCDLTSIFLPREAVEALLPRRLRLDGLVIPKPLAALLQDHAEGLARTLAAGTLAEAAPALAQATLHLFAAAIAGAPPAEEEGRRAVDAALRRRIDAYIDTHLLEPDLSQDRLCRTFHMSRATLYRLFQPLGGVAAHVQQRRLARIHTELCDPTRHHHLGRLAETYGFSSQTQMGRAFKAHYGVSPSEAAGAILPASGNGTIASDFGSWLRALGA